MKTIKKDLESMQGINTETDLKKEKKREYGKKDTIICLKITNKD